jgi:hypothetical protein
MDALTLLREQVAMTERVFRQVFATVTPEQAIWRGEGSTANQIAALFLHVYTGEDRAVQRARGRPPLLETEGWAAHLRYDVAAPWSPIDAPDLEVCRAYAAAVSAATSEYLANVEPGEIEREVETPRGKRTVVGMLSLGLITHKLTHMGEIAALLGCQGVKGFPF